MNQLVTTPDVKLFVAAVREHLGDLTDDEREELVGGLEGDMSDLVAERGVDALPEPAAYAAELRAAAGFEPVARARPRTGLGTRTAALLDRGTATWSSWVAAGDFLRLPALLTSTRPVWWVARGFAAAALVVELRGSQSLYGLTTSRAAVVALAVVGSVLLGAWWAARERRPVSWRLLLAGLNILAVLLAPVAYQRFLQTPGWVYDELDAAWAAPVATGDTLLQDGREITNIQAYDAEGRPLVGVQLLDQRGEPIRVPRESFDEDAGEQVRLTPWRAGLRDVPNVFPMPERRTDNETGAWTEEPELPAPPVASLPPVALDGIVASRVATPSEVRALERAERGERTRR